MAIVSAREEVTHPSDETNQNKTGPDTPQADEYVGQTIERYLDNSVRQKRMALGHEEPQELGGFAD